ncbi:glutathione peroxidase [Acidocella aromatica]|uniref:Glutathione peroxidase n=1 Tax=Acidocella aromatica TaxID=1303579 RepID=A0A840V9K1_9PROT|nr:glutathione peroxidase [Acidocella aromatica]MBB5372416.1 glutathione peroxidase [Acidocella aromatica]
MTSAYDFSFTTLQGQPYPLRALEGRPLLVVNTASKCGFTPQYKGLEAVWREFAPKGLVVIGIPCNDFGGQEPGNAAEIEQFCEVNYGVSFPMMSKVHVKGAEAHPFFTWASGQGGFFSRPRWNFYKYLINKQGQLEDWFSSKTAPDSAKLKAAIQRTL